MPSIMEGSILIMSKTGTGTAMFSMGELFFSSFLCYFFMSLYDTCVALGK